MHTFQQTTNNVIKKININDSEIYDDSKIDDNYGKIDDSDRQKQLMFWKSWN